MKACCWFVNLVTCVYMHVSLYIYICVCVYSYIKNKYNETDRNLAYLLYYMVNKIFNHLLQNHMKLHFDIFLASIFSSKIFRMLWWRWICWFIFLEMSKMQSKWRNSCKFHKSFTCERYFVNIMGNNTSLRVYLYIHLMHI